MIRYDVARPLYTGSRRVAHAPVLAGPAAACSSPATAAVRWSTAERQARACPATTARVVAPAVLLHSHASRRSPAGVAPGRRAGCRSAWEKPAHQRCRRRRQLTTGCVVFARRLRKDARAADIKCSAGAGLVPAATERHATVIINKDNLLAPAAAGWQPPVSIHYPPYGCCSFCNNIHKPSHLL